LEITVVNDLKYDLFSSVSAAKQGLTSIIDYDLQTGKNNSYTIDNVNLYRNKYKYATKSTGYDTKL